MQPLEQNQAALIRPNENGDLLPNFQNTRRDFLNELRPEGFPFLNGHVNLIDWKTFRVGHSVSPHSGSVQNAV